MNGVLIAYQKLCKVLPRVKTQMQEPNFQDRKANSEANGLMFLSCLFFLGGGCHKQELQLVTWLWVKTYSWNHVGGMNIHKSELFFSADQNGARGVTHPQWEKEPLNNDQPKMRKQRRSLTHLFPDQKQTGNTFVFKRQPAENSAQTLWICLPDTVVFDPDYLAGATGHRSKFVLPVGIVFNILNSADQQSLFIPNIIYRQHDPDVVECVQQIKLMRRKVFCLALKL